MKLLISTNPQVGHRILSGIYNKLVWASDNLETVAHYYEGCVIEIDVNLAPEDRMPYVACTKDLDQLGLGNKEYQYGFEEMKCPAGATWYSFSAHYLSSNLLSAREVFPDLSPWCEEE